MTDDEVADWFRFDYCNDDYSEDAVQYCNGVSTFFLLSRTNAISLGERLTKTHNAYSLKYIFYICITFY